MYFLAEMDTIQEEQGRNLEKRKCIILSLPHLSSVCGLWMLRWVTAVMKIWVGVREKLLRTMSPLRDSLILLFRCDRTGFWRVRTFWFTKLYFGTVMLLGWLPWELGNELLSIRIIFSRDHAVEHPYSLYGFTFFKGATYGCVFIDSYEDSKN